MSKIKANIIVLGETGNGKSQFCNAVLQRQVFTVSDDTKSETKITKGSYGINDAEKIFAIDTPGLQDSEGTDKEHLKQLINYVKEQTHLQAVLIIFNFHQPRFPMNIKTMVKLLCNAFPQTDFWSHVGLVFTKFYSFLPDKQKKNKEKFSIRFNKEIEDVARESGQNYSLGNQLICPTFFVDSPSEDEEMEQNTKEEINRLIVWASNLEPLDVKKTQEVDPNIMKEEIEYEEKKINENNNMKQLIKTITYAKYKRKKQFHYDGQITYTDWEEIDKYTKEEKIPKEVVNVLTDQKYEFKKTKSYIRVADPENTNFIRRMFNDYNYKDIVVPDTEVTSKEVRKFVYNNGEVKYENEI